MSALLPPIAADGDIVAALLREQQSLSAVEQFSFAHEREFADEPAQTRYYRRLMPVTSPGPNQQLAFEVDLDSCSGCKACVVACHTLNGLDEHETWRSVGMVVADDTIQHVTTACHHCEDPGCLNGCPVKAYVKDEVTGIVRHLDDQCIGCKYCTMMCPYEVPKYSDRLGIVRKCDMCHQRLSTGEAPACVQACPNEAIKIRIVDVASPVIAKGAEARLSPGAPLSSITRPTTIYRSRQATNIAAAVPQDAGVDAVADSHWPLAAMLVATQAAIGLLVIERTMALGSIAMGQPWMTSVTRVSATLAVLIAGIGMNIAPLHLGQPLKAWRVFLGLRTSWLSREAVILGGFMGLLAGAVALLWMPVVADYVPRAIESLVPNWAATVTLTASVPVGLAGFFSSAMIYIATQRQLWRYERTMIRFGGSMLVLGTPCFALALAIARGSSSLVAGLAILSIVAVVAKIAFESLTHYFVTTDSLARRSAKLVRGPLRPWLIGRMTSACAATLMLGLAVVMDSDTLVIAGLSSAVLLLTLGEFAERFLYFASVVHDRMPGTMK